MKRTKICFKSRMYILSAVVLFFIFAPVKCLYAGTDGDGSLAKIMQGNKRFVTGQGRKNDTTDKRRKELVEGQHPFATILTCSDSRVPPEHIFNQGLGDIFIVRVAGNVIDEIAIGSIEYGVEHLHTPLLIILGHTSCGAVKATVDLTGEPHGNIGAILKKIMPAVKTAREHAKGEADVLDLAIIENINNVNRELLERSSIIRELVHENKVKVVPALYRLDSGKVEVLDVSAIDKHSDTGTIFNIRQIFQTLISDFTSYGILGGGAAIIVLAVLFLIIRKVKKN